LGFSAFSFLVAIKNFPGGGRGPSRHKHY
jgi:hypothetical protein